jgi:hypothetical protein
MSAALKKKPRVVIPTLAERGEALLAEIADLPLHERIDALRPFAAAVKPLLDRTLDEMAEERRPKGKLTTDTPDGQPAIVGSIPAEFIRRTMDIKGAHCLLNTFVESTKS